PPQAAVRERDSALQDPGRRSRSRLMERRFGLISVDDHVQEPPDLWTERLSAAKWGDRRPHLEQSVEGDRWMVDGQILLDGRVATVGAALADRTRDAVSWDEVPAAAYRPADRLKAMD